MRDLHMLFQCFAVEYYHKKQWYYLVIYKRGLIWVATNLFWIIQGGVVKVL